jgi:tetratricopeptide (TPR) repeat protein
VRPEAASAYYEMGVTFKKMRFAGEALQNYEKAAQLDPSLADAVAKVKKEIGK